MVFPFSVYNITYLMAVRKRQTKIAPGYICQQFSLHPFTDIYADAVLDDIGHRRGIFVILKIGSGLLHDDIYYAGIFANAAMGILDNAAVYFRIFLRDTGKLHFISVFR